MILLAIDTSTEYCSAALLRGESLSVRGETIGRGHAERILPMVDELLGEAGLAPGELQGVAFGRGPGAFTGLRIAAGVAQGLAYAAGCRVVAVSSLAAVGWQVRAHPGERVLACNDARMGEVYWAVFEVGAHGLLTPCGPERVTPPERVAAEADGRIAPRRRQRTGGRARDCATGSRSLGYGFMTACCRRPRPWPGSASSSSLPVVPWRRPRRNRSTCVTTWSVAMSRRCHNSRM